MTHEQLSALLTAGEGLTTEFKECRAALNRDVYESVCAFLNRHGGVVLLGVRDDGEVSGIDPARLEQMRHDLVTALNNPQKLNPPIYLAPEQLEVEGRVVLALSIPESSQVHRCNGRIFDRAEDGDLDVTAQNDAVAKLYCASRPRTPKRASTHMSRAPSFAPTCCSAFASWRAASGPTIRGWSSTTTSCSRARVCFSGTTRRVRRA